ncbi:MAG: hypothetical protein IKE06_09840 [Solobacterium sp.]|nr:hypothetical protein [Solobacterium sp.]MBR2829837.1 hypothetical protein [Solobacterium sp.]MBR3128298.1 hypothetical protein [Solobacterium sp.]
MEYSSLDSLTAEKCVAMMAWILHHPGGQPEMTDEEDRAAFREIRQVLAAMEAAHD